MPRTKVSKNSKRNRDAANREEKIRLYESNMEAFQFRFDRAEQEYISEIDSEFNMLLARISKKLLQIKMSEFFELNLNKFDDWVNHNITSTASNLTLSNSTNGSALCNSTMGTMQRSTKITNPNDEGYLTEDSTTGSTGTSTLLAFTSSTSTSGTSLQRNPSQRLLRTPGGPMASARLRRPRRSRSASGDLVPGSAIKAQMSAQRQQTIQSEHNSRNKLRTPMAARNKAFSADRSVKVRTDRERSSSPKSPPTAILRWPKPGELVLSKCGSPLVAQVMSDKYANVNIPIRNGVLSLQPKKLGQLNKELIDNIDADTINQIKTLQANLNIIMDIVADKAPK